MEIEQRNIGGLYKGIALFLLGASLSGVMSYAALWGAFIKNAVTADQVANAMQQQDKVYNTEIADLKAIISNQEQEISIMRDDLDKLNETVTLIEIRVGLVPQSK